MMVSKQNRNNVLFGKGQLGPYPMHRFKRVDKPTNLITDNVQRIDYREHAINRAFRGDFGSAVQAAAPHVENQYPITAAQIDVLLSLAGLQDNEVADSKAPIPEDPTILSRHIKRLGYFLKADIMGICRVPQGAMYSHNKLGQPINTDYKYAIVIVMGKEYQTVKASTGSDWIVTSISFQCYQHLAFVSRTIADYIRRLGHPAVACHTFQLPEGYRALMPPLLLWSGIGEVSRAGIILNPYLGPCFKAAAVLTDLPLMPDKPIDFGLQDFCQVCKICAHACPVNAISTGDKVMYNGYETWKLDESRCVSWFMGNTYGTGCGVCQEVCPWTRPPTWPHNLVRWMVRHSALARKLAVKVDTIRGRANPGHENKEDKWWFDVHEVEGVLRSAPTKE